MDTNATQQTPPGLADLFSAGGSGASIANGGGQIAATPSFMGLLSQQQQMDQVAQQNQQRELQYNLANDPLRLQQQSLANQTTQAQLPGVVGQSQSKAAQGQIDQGTVDSNIQQILGSNNSKDIERQVGDMENVGSIFAQQGEAAFASPMGAAQRAKAALMKAGHGDMWNPQWETMSPTELSDALSTTGQQIQQTSSQFRQRMAEQQLKNTGAAAVEAQRAEASQRVADIRNQTMQKIQESKERMMKENPKGLPMFAAQMRYQSTLTDDPTLKNAYLQAASESEQAAQRIAAAAPAQVQSGKPDINKLGIPTLGGSGAVTPPIAGAQPGGGTPPPVVPHPAGSAKEADWIARAKAANPGMSEEEIRAQGKALGKIQ